MLVPKSVGTKENSITCKAVDQSKAMYCVHWGKIYVVKYIGFVAVNRNKNNLDVQRHKQQLQTPADTVFIVRL
jgi:hypothetical protein